MSSTSIFRIISAGLLCFLCLAKVHAATVLNPGSQPGGTVTPLVENPSATSIDIEFTAMNPIQVDLDFLGASFDDLNIPSIVNSTGVAWSSLELTVSGGACMFSDVLRIFPTTGQVSGVTFNGSPVPSGCESQILIAFSAAAPETAGLTGGFTRLGQLGAGVGSLIITPGAVSAVPVPAALWLFVSGLCGLFGITRCRRTA